MEHVLEKKIRYFFRAPYRGREDLVQTLSNLCVYGHPVLVGGMLRDLAISGNLYFNSDLDFVIDPLNLNLFEEYMKEIGAVQNRFGGYSLPSKKWRVDVWPLKKTWAHLEGHVNIEEFDDLKNATFFNCDAIAYSFLENKFYAKDDYFYELSIRKLEINLEENPNPTGNIIRSIRYAINKGFKWGPKLSGFIFRRIESDGFSVLKKYNGNSFNYVDLIDEVLFMRGLRDYLLENDEYDLFYKDNLFNPMSFVKNTQMHLPYEI